MDDKDTDLVSVMRGDILSLPVSGFGKSGDPVVRVGGGMILFVKIEGAEKPGKGEVLKVRVTRVLDKFGFAELM